MQLSRSKIGWAFAVLMVFPADALANSPIVSSGLPGFVLFSMIYIGALFLSGRSRTLQWGQVLFWVLMIVIFTMAAHIEAVFHLWGFYICAQCCLLLLTRKRVVCRDRRSDLKWYGAWTALILGAGLALKISELFTKGVNEFVYNTVNGLVDLVGFLPLFIFALIFAYFNKQRPTKTDAAALSIEES